MTKENAQQGAKRYDFGKQRWDLIDWRSIFEIVKVYTFGAKKYSDHNWRNGMSYSRVWASLQRHLNDFWVDGEMYDKESGVHHLAHAAWNAITLMWYSWFLSGAVDKTTGAPLDDRPSQVGWAKSPLMKDEQKPEEE